MISITRDLARQLRSVLRKAGAGKNNRPTLQLESSGRDLFVRAQLPLLTIECRVDSRQDTETLPLPVDALEEFNNKNTEQITFVRTKDGVEASWEDDRIPRRKCYEVPTTAQFTIPTVDWSKGTVVPGLLEALANASQCVGTDHVRYDTHLVQLRGKSGEVIATDGHQALVQGGFTFPWQEDLLIPCATLFTCRELSIAMPATVAKGKNHLGIQVFEWTIYLATRRKMSETHKRLGTRPPRGRAWTPKEDAFVRSLPIKEAARRTGRSLASIHCRRRVLEIPDGRAHNGMRPHGGPWTAAEDALFVKRPTKIIATKTGRPLYAVYHRREHLRRQGVTLFDGRHLNGKFPRRQRASKSSIR